VVGAVGAEPSPGRLRTTSAIGLVGGSGLSTTATGLVGGFSASGCTVTESHGFVVVEKSV